MRSALDFAHDRSFSPSGADIGGRPPDIGPNALIGDREGADAAPELVRGYEPPILHVSMQEWALCPFRGGAREDLGNGARPGSTTIRNVLPGVRNARGGVAR